MTDKLPQRILRRLVAAEGFLELDMPHQALEELAAVDDYGALEMPAQFLKGKALKAQERYDDAIPALQRAARLAPAALSSPIWLMLGECLRHRGQNDLADVAETFAHASQPVKVFAPVLNIQITIVNNSADGDEEGAGDEPLDEFEPDSEFDS